MATREITKTRFKAKALEYLRQVESTGESLVITDRGRPAVEVRRIRSDSRTPLERLRGSVVQYESPTAPVGEQDWEALS